MIRLKIKSLFVSIKRELIQLFEEDSYCHKQRVLKYELNYPRSGSC